MKSGGGGEGNGARSWPVGPVGGGGGGGGGGGERGAVGYFERGEACGTTMRALVNKCPVDHLNFILLFSPSLSVLSLRSAANFPAI